MQNLADKAKLLRKEAKGVQHMVMKDEVWITSLLQCFTQVWIVRSKSNRFHFPRLV